MPDNRRVQRNTGFSNSSSNPSGNSIGEAVRRLRIQTDGKEDETTVDPIVYPDRPGEPDCIYYLRTGVCGYGDKCRFNHATHIGQVNQHEGDLPERVGEPDCAYFLKTGTCKYGSTCKYNHPRDRRGAGPVVLNMAGLPIRQGQKSCPHYIRTGSCKFGVTCKFNHPQPGVDGSNLPVAPPGAPQHMNGAASWLYQSPQTYLPMVLPAAGPNQGWSAYVGSVSPVLSNGSGSINHVYPQPPMSHLPERPGEPECRYFMNSGTCKYGSDCKYHHPKDKMAQPGVGSLSPLGLPIRPGQPVCSFYSQYGICKYGPTCKYDHPLMVYSYNYTMGMPHLPILDSSFFAYGGRNTPTLHSSESSSSEPTSKGKLSNDGSPSQSQSD